MYPGFQQPMYGGYQQGQPPMYAPGPGGFPPMIDESNIIFTDEEGYY
jgi:hypothetical protein